MAHLPSFVATIARKMHHIQDMILVLCFYHSPLINDRVYRPSEVYCALLLEFPAEVSPVNDDEFDMLFEKRLRIRYCFDILRVMNDR